MNYWGKNNSITTKSLQKSYMKINESLKKYESKWNIGKKSREKKRYV